MKAEVNERLRDQIPAGSLRLSGGRADLKREVDQRCKRGDRCDELTQASEILKRHVCYSTAALLA